MDVVPLTQEERETLELYAAKTKKDRNLKEVVIDEARGVVVYVTQDGERSALSIRTVLSHVIPL